MKLRKLELKDAEQMLLWMHDDRIVKNLMADFKSKTLKDCISFIKTSWQDKDNQHMAVVDEEDVYLGTVSLKNIRNNTAEFAIAVGSKAMGTGIPAAAMKEMIRMGFEDMGLNKIYWCVSPENKRALRFYDKNMFRRVSASEIPAWKGKTGKKLIWYLEKKTMA